MSKSEKPAKVECEPWFPRCYDGYEEDQDDDDGVPCRERPPPTHIISKLYVIYQRYKFVILATTFSAFLGIFFSGLLFTTATEGRVKTCFGPDCGDMKEAELQGKIVAVGHPAEVLQKLHYPEPPGSKPPEAKGYDRSQPWDMVKLPSFARPRHYKLLLQPDVDRQAFRGQVEITLELRRPTDFLVFHAKNLTITTLSLFTMVQTSAVGEAGQMGKKVYASEKDIVMVPKNEQVFLQTATSVNDKCNLTLKMSFQGHLSDGLEGLYLSKYKNGDGAVSNIVSTHFEPSSARLAFPCWDEPEFKAKFTISVVRPKGLISLSNMPLKKTEDLQFYQPGTERDDFMTSVPMSTYLVAIAVCDYVYLRSTTAKGVKISLYAPAEQVSRGGLALNTALQVLTYYEEFFGVSYPLPKLDMIAIPGFSAGAMENWGLVTYRMTSLLADDAVSSERQKQIVVQTVAHELAHQWFGNLVTMKWWNDLWLNEGFASWVEVLGAKVSNPDWAITDQFYYDKVTSGLWLDSLQSSHPVSPPEISSVDESNSLFDEISYNKGPALLQMVADVIGLPTLRLGLKTYLKTHRYGNADTKDLWAAVGSFTDFGAEGMKNFMNSWVDKQGYPLIELSMDDGELIARQRRYSNSRTPPCPGPAEAHLSNSPCSDIWNLRLTCLVGGRDGAVTRDGAWMNKTSTSFTLRKNMKYVKCNVQGKGFYRVAYSADLWRMLQASIDDSPSSFDTLDKASLFSDAFALTWFGASPSGIQRPMKLALCLLPRETDYTVWATALEELARIDTLLRFQPEQKRFRDFLCRVMKTVYETLGWVHEGSHLDKMLRAKIMETSVMIEMNAAVETGVDLFKSWKVSIEDYIKHARPGETSMKKRLPPDLRLSVYIAGVRYLGKDAFDLCLKVYKRCNNPVQRQDLLIAMTKTRNIAQLEWLLQQLNNRDLIALQDVRTVFVGIARNPAGMFLAWRHMQKHWETMYDELSGSALGGMLVEVLSQFNNKFDINQAENFFNGRRMKKVIRNYNQGLEMAYLNVWWLETHGEELKNWLEDSEPAKPVSF